MRLLDTANRLHQLRLGGAALPTQVAEAATEAVMQYAAGQTGQLKLTVQDTPKGDLWVSPLLKRGVVVDYGDQQLVIRTVIVAQGKGGPLITIIGRSRVIAAMRAQTGKRSWGRANVSGWVRDRVAEAAGQPVIQPGLGVEPVTRQDGNTEESSWDVTGRLASTVGAVVFEADQHVWFGRPTWIAQSGPGRRWAFQWKTQDDYSPLLCAQPTYRGSDDGDVGEQLDLQLLGDEADLIRPGHVVELTGRVGAAGGVWWVTGVDIPGSLIKPVAVSLERPIDPKPTRSS